MPAIGLHYDHGGSRPIGSLPPLCPSRWPGLHVRFPWPGAPPLFDLLCSREPLMQGLRPPSSPHSLICYPDALLVSKSVPPLACLGLGLWSGFCFSRCGVLSAAVDPYCLSVVCACSGILHVAYLCCWTLQLRACFRHVCVVRLSRLLAVACSCRGR